MQFSLQIRMDNAAFQDGEGGGSEEGDFRPELARILDNAARMVQEGWDIDRVLMDINGNRVGQMGVTP